METKEKPKPSPDYLMQLMNDKKLMSSLPNFCGIFNHLERLLDEEISRVRKDMYNDTLNGSTEKRSAELPDAVGPIVQLQEKLYVPVKEYPDVWCGDVNFRRRRMRRMRYRSDVIIWFSGLPSPFSVVFVLPLTIPGRGILVSLFRFNFVGRILGPRGLTAKQLEAETGCKIMVRGKGSMRDKKKVLELVKRLLERHSGGGSLLRQSRRVQVSQDPGQEEQNRGKPNWEHLNEDLHVLITVEDAQNRAEIKLKRAVEEVKKLLIPAAKILIQECYGYVSRVNIGDGGELFKEIVYYSAMRTTSGKSLTFNDPQAEGEDSLKKMQLMELAILNGTYRDANIKSPTAQAPRIITGPAPVLPPAALRTPTPAGPTIMPLIRQIQTAVMPNGTPHPTAAIVPPGPEAGLIYTPYEYPYTLAPATSILEYPIEPSGVLGAVATKVRRHDMRVHPYQRIVTADRGLPVYKFHDCLETDEHTVAQIYQVAGVEALAELMVSRLLTLTWTSGWTSDDKLATVIEDTGLHLQKHFILWKAWSFFSDSVLVQRVLVPAD
ncbi:hypothetical protein DUI87_10187 [Hirundo rustica rustica]|uniref:K Homology domain-containing protein n=1 Tax=Hirundo rustica rustica TaxID=333673 RepID=A0A3M0KHN6_HIRRU|nr:hypothetical protein DUI87_10187 [Hirundo rustica rustica]